jgi:hypothetical protein
MGRSVSIERIIAPQKQTDTVTAATKQLSEESGELVKCARYTLQSISQNLALLERLRLNPKIIARLGINIAGSPEWYIQHYCFETRLSITFSGF